MATERFTRLPREKQEAILRAAIKEFAHVPWEKVSINKIIRDAEISRGSFYTYFEDKKDVLRYIFTGSTEQFREYLTTALQRNEGDIWDTLEDFLEFLIQYCYRQGLFEFFRNIMLNANSDEMLRGVFDVPTEGDEQFKDLLQWLYDHADKREFRIESLEEFHTFLQVAMTSLMISLREFYKEGDSPDLAKSDYHKKLELLRYGVCR